MSNNLARLSRAAVAFVTLSAEEGDAHYVLRFSHEWKQLNLVGGHVRAGEGAFAAMSRKIAGELRVAPKNVRVLRDPLFAMRYDSVSLRTGEPTRYEVDVFGAVLLVDKVQVVTDGCVNLWLTATQIASGVGPGGVLVSEMTLRAVDRLVELMEPTIPCEEAARW